MKILVVSQYFWPENFLINDVTQALCERGHEVVVLTGKPNYPEGSFFPGYSFWGQWKEGFSGAKILRVPIISRGHNSSVRLALNYLSFALFGSIFAPVCVKEHYDAILVFAPSPIIQAIPALVLQALGKGATHVWLLDLWPDSLSATGAIRSKWIIRLIGAATAFIHRRAKSNFVSCEGFTEDLEKMGVDPLKISYLPNYAVNVHCDGAMVPPNITGSRAFRVMFAGNIGVAQDFPTILDAAVRLKHDEHIQWIIVGGGRNLSWVKDEVERRGLQQNVLLAGRFPADQMPRWFGCADVMLVTLSSDPIFARTLPAKIQAYMAASKPIIAALSGEGARLIGEANCGICAPAGNAVQLAEAVLKAAQMSVADLQRLGANGRRFYVENFERESVIDKLEQLMRPVGV